VNLLAGVAEEQPLVCIVDDAPAAGRDEVHRALADATDARLDPDRRAWHRARAADRPDEAVAGELERSAERRRHAGGCLRPQHSCSGPPS